MEATRGLQEIWSIPTSPKRFQAPLRWPARPDERSTRRTPKIVGGVLSCGFYVNTSLKDRCRVLTQGVWRRISKSNRNSKLANSLVFGYSKFKGKQKQIVEAAYCGELTMPPARYMRSMLSTKPPMSWLWHRLAWARCEYVFIYYFGRSMIP